MTKIEWATTTWNPITGCTKISEGCQNCYAERMSKRLAGRYGYPKDDPFKVIFHHDKRDQPWKWKKQKRVFVCSMGDLFHDDVDPGYQYDIFKTAFDLRFRHTFVFLTKRPDNMLRFMSNPDMNGYCSGKPFLWHNGLLPASFWLGVTAENQKRADERIPILLQIPAAVRFVSVEPMLGPVDLDKTCGPYHCWREGLDWVICGGESGPRARPMYPEWARSLKDQCSNIGIPFFMKQMSGRTKAERKAIPDDLMTREYPDEVS